MIWLLAMQVSSLVNGAACVPTREAHLAEAKAVQKRVEALFEERKLIVARRAEIAKQRMKNAEMSSIKRSLKDTFGGLRSEESLDRRDAAFQVRLNSIAEEGQVLAGELQLMKIKHESELAVCSAGKE